MQWRASLSLSSSHLYRSNILMNTFNSMKNIKTESVLLRYLVGLPMRYLWVSTMLQTNRPTSKFKLMNVIINGVSSK